MWHRASDSTTEIKSNNKTPLLASYNYINGILWTLMIETQTPSSWDCDRSKQKKYEEYGFEGYKSNYLLRTCWSIDLKTLNSKSFNDAFRFMITSLCFSTTVVSWQICLADCVFSLARVRYCSSNYLKDYSSQTHVTWNSSLFNEAICFLSTFVFIQL